MVDVDNGKAEVEFRPEFQEDVKEAKGVSAPGDGDAYDVAGTQHGVAGDGLADWVEEGHGNAG